MRMGRVGVLRRRSFRTPSASQYTPALNRYSGQRSVAVFFIEMYDGGDRYYREQYLKVLSTSDGPTATLTFRGGNLSPSSAGGHRTLLGDTYELIIDGVPTGIITDQFTSGGGLVRARGSFVVPLENLSEGWHTFSIAVPESEWCPPYFYYVRKGGPLVQPLIPVCNTTYDLVNRNYDYTWGLVKPGTPTPRPLTPRECPEFAEVLTPSDLCRTNIVPIRPSILTMSRPNVNKDGVMSTFTAMWYFWGHTKGILAKYPPVPLLDGPRGVGSFGFPTHIQIDRHGNAYACDPWRVVRIDQTGKVTTRAGWRHNYPPDYWVGVDNADRVRTATLVGNWSAIPEARRGFHELWGLAFDENSVVLDEGAPQQQNPNTGEMEHPHPGPVRLFVADTQNNRICLLEFPGNQFGSEAVVTEFITDLADPWDVIWDDDKLYIAEREAHRIRVHNAITGDFIEYLIEGPAQGTIADLGGPTGQRTGVLKAGVSMEQARAYDCILPEGLFLQDGWLYFGSQAIEQIRRVNLITREVQMVCNPAYSGAKVRYHKIALSDGTFGPRGTVFVWSWSIDGPTHGLPRAFLPNTPGVATIWDQAGNPQVANDDTIYRNSGRWSIHANTTTTVEQGRGNRGWAPIQYMGAGGVGMGRMYASSSAECLVMISKALPSDPSVTTADINKYVGGREKFRNRGYHLIHGEAGFGHHGYPLPWNEDADIDFYLERNGHQKP